MYSQASYAVGAQGRSENRHGNTLPAFAMGAYSQVQTPSGSGGQWQGQGQSQPQPQPQPQQSRQSTASAVLYYSNYCTICNNLIRMIASRNLKNVFALVCVDQDRSRVPQFVKSVPLAYISGRATGGAPQLLIEGALLEYIERCASQRQNAMSSPGSASMAGRSQVASPAPPSAPEELGMMNSSGGSYSFLEEYASEGRPGDGIPGSSLYQLNGEDLDFRIEGIPQGAMPLEDIAVRPREDGHDSQSLPSFLNPVETRKSSGCDVDVSTIETTRRTDEEWFKQKHQHR